jgi:hypothetical protein
LVISGPILEILRTVEEVLDGRMASTWRRQYLLSLVAQALAHLSYDDVGNRGHQWFARLAARAFAAFRDDRREEGGKADLRGMVPVPAVSPENTHPADEAAPPAAPPAQAEDPAEDGSAAAPGDVVPQQVGGEPPENTEPRDESPEIRALLAMWDDPTSGADALRVVGHEELTEVLDAYALRRLGRPPDALTLLVQRAARPMLAQASRLPRALTRLSLCETPGTALETARDCLVLVTDLWEQLHRLPHLDRDAHYPADWRAGWRRQWTDAEQALETLRTGLPADRKAAARLEKSVADLADAGRRCEVAIARLCVLLLGGSLTPG